MALRILGKVLTIGFSIPSHSQTQPRRANSISGQRHGVSEQECKYHVINVRLDCIGHVSVSGTKCLSIAKNQPKTSQRGKFLGISILAPRVAPPFTSSHACEISYQLLLLDRMPPLFQDGVDVTESGAAFMHVSCRQFTLDSCLEYH